MKVKTVLITPFLVFGCGVKIAPSPALDAPSSRFQDEIDRRGAESKKSISDKPTPKPSPSPTPQVSP